MFKFRHPEYSSPFLGFLACFLTFLDACCTTARRLSEVFKKVYHWVDNNARCLLFVVIMFTMVIVDKISKLPPFSFLYSHIINLINGYQKLHIDDKYTLWGLLSFYYGYFSLWHSYSLLTCFLSAFMICSIIYAYGLNMIIALRGLFYISLACILLYKILQLILMIYNYSLLVLILCLIICYKFFVVVSNQRYVEKFIGE